MDDERVITTRELYDDGELDNTIRDGSWRSFELDLSNIGSGGSGYTLPIASATTLGGIKIPANGQMTIDKDGNLLEKSSDDGEPSGTAGAPILNVIRKNNMNNILIVVTRYFGGTLLGTGGLIRAYTKSTQEGIKESMVIEKCLGVMLSLTCDYTTSGKIQYLTATEHIPVLDTVYTDNVTFEMIVPVEEVGSVEKKFMEASMGKAVLKKGEETYYAEIDGKISYDL